MYKTKILYIASNGRSGSTLLEKLLCRDGKNFSVGEIEFLDKERRSNSLCSCGKAMDQCRFWSPLIQSGTSTLFTYPFSYFRSIDSRVVQPKIIISIIKKLLVGEGYINLKFQDYIQKNEEAFKKISKMSGYDCIVDSSKDPYRMYLLSESQELDVAVLHMIKHPCSFVFSMNKNLSGLARYIRAARMSFRWTFQNLLIIILVRLSPCTKYCRIKYEDLATRPSEIMNLVTGLKFTGSHVNSTKNISHSIAGNDLRFSNRKIILDERWKTQQHLIEKWTILCLTFPLKWAWSTQVKLDEYKYIQEG